MMNNNQLSQALDDITNEDLVPPKIKIMDVSSPFDPEPVENHRGITLKKFMQLRPDAVEITTNTSTPVLRWFRVKSKETIVTVDHVDGTGHTTRSIKIRRYLHDLAFRNNVWNGLLNTWVEDRDPELNTQS